MPNVSDLTKKKKDYDGKISGIGKQYFTSDFNKFTIDILGEQTKNKILVNKSDILRFINNSDLNNKIST